MYGIPKAPTLSLQELYRERNLQRSQEIQTFHKVLEVCHHHIRMAAQGGDLYTLYDVPAFMIGVPLFNQRNCCDYIMTQLKKIGLYVEEHPNREFTLFISWDPNDISKNK